MNDKTPRYCLNYGEFHKWTLHTIEGGERRCGPSCWKSDLDETRYAVWYCETCRWLDREPLQAGSPFHHMDSRNKENP